jgi:hypothetical protein
LTGQTSDYFLTGTLTNGILSNASNLCGVLGCTGMQSSSPKPTTNVYATLPSFDFYPTIAEPQVRANQFNQQGLVTIDGSTN